MSTLPLAHAGDPPHTVAPDEAGPPAPVGRRAILAWFLFDWAAQPVNTLITTFVIPPFFVGVVVPRFLEAIAASDPASAAATMTADDMEAVGQAWWGWAAALAGIAVAILSPILGAIADAAGRRKPWIAAFGALLVLGSFALWFAEPGAPGAVIIALIGFAIATLGDEFATVFNNAMMPRLVAADRLGRLSGSGWAMGYFGGMLALVILLAFFVANADETTTFFGFAPLFGLEPATYEGVRATGPLTALWFVVFVIPMFLYVPDTPRLMPVRAAVRMGLATLRKTLTGLRGEYNMLRFLIARMIYADGLAGLFAFGGVYAASTFDWGTTETLLFGVVVIVAAIPGAFLGGRLDDRLGSKAVILGSLTVLVVASLLAVSIDADSILFGIASAPPLADDGLFASTGEQLYLILGAAIGAVAGPLQAASRALLVRLAPRPRITQFFGLYALTGKLTTFVAALAVALLTTLSGSQRIGISVLVVFFVAGGVLMLGVRERQTGRA
ncbi:MAG: MFS transporter [Bauldia sp.]|nr:MFS transporter [Bauldia sp.]